MATNFHLPLLPGQPEFVFSMYGAPGDLEQLKQLVAVMREKKLGNGFDPGPGPHPNSKPVVDYLATVGWPLVCYSGAEMQIKGGRSVFGREQEAVLSVLDRAGVFSAIQLGEWGYYFHNLAPNESWWRDVYGKEFDDFKHLMKPPGLAGYDRRPTSRQECYDVLKDYFTSRSRDLLGRVISVTGHSHYEAYAGEWGARCIGLEVGENIAFTQSKFAFARGASRPAGPRASSVTTRCRTSWDSPTRAGMETMRPPTLCTTWTTLHVCLRTARGIPLRSFSTVRMRGNTIHSTHTTSFGGSMSSSRRIHGCA